MTEGKETYGICLLTPTVIQLLAQGHPEAVGNPTLQGSHSALPSPLVEQQWTHMQLLLARTGAWKLLFMTGVAG